MTDPQSWPTLPDENGFAPPVLQLMADPLLVRQAMYLVQAGARLKESGYQPEGFQIPIAVDDFRTTLPLALQDREGNRAMVYTNCAPWDGAKIASLRAWIQSMRQTAGVHPSIPVIVVSQFDCTELRSLAEITQFLVLPLLGRTGPAERPPPAELGLQLADACVGIFRNAQVHLDYSEGSLALVDERLGQWREGSDSDLTDHLQAAGAYVGEVIVRHLSGQWRNVEGTPIEKVASGPIVIELPGEVFCNPLGKAWKRFDQGPGDSVAFFFAALKNKIYAREN